MTRVPFTYPHVASMRRFAVVEAGAGGSTVLAPVVSGLPVLLMEHFAPPDGMSASVFGAVGDEMLQLTRRLSSMGLLPTVLPAPISS